jgi:hypothetical protein
MDKNYSADAEVSFNNGGHRMVRINCDVVIKVYDSSNTLVAEIVEENRSELPSSIIYGIDEDGQKYVVLPPNEDYRIEITATKDGTVNYGIGEYAACEGDYVRNINYFDIYLKQGETLTGYLPSYSQSEREEDTPNGTNVAYSLFAPNGSEIEPTSELRGEESVNAYFSVDVDSSDNSGGIVLGSGLRQYGQFAQVESHAKEGYEFEGWYVEDELVSQEQNYRFCVMENTEVLGVFHQLPTDETSENKETSATEDKSSNE